MIWPLFRYILMAAGRDRFVWGLLGVLAITVSLSNFFGASVITEQNEFASTFAAFGFRLFGVTCVVMFIGTYIRRCFENRDIDFLLSRPIGRMQFVFTHAAAFSTLAILTALVMGGTILGLEKHGAEAGFYLWWVSIMVEFLIMANVAMFFAFVITSSTACLLAIFSFYLLCRLMGDILGIMQNHSVELQGKYLAMSKIMEAISMFIPRLDLMGQTKWLIYGPSSEITYAFLLGQGAVFASLIIAATAIDMHRRQF